VKELCLFCGNHIIAGKSGTKKLHLEFLERRSYLPIARVEPNLTVAVLQLRDGGMFQVTVLSEPNSTVPEFVPDQTTLGNVPQKNNAIIVRTETTTS
jgi:hypothetical protein